MNLPLQSLTQSSSKRTTFLSEGVKLAGILCAICAAPLPFVSGWIAAWLLGVLTLIGLGTFGIWAFNAVTNRPLLNSEEHTEQMAAIAVMGQNREGKPPILHAVDQTILTKNPEMIEGPQEMGHG